MGNQDLPTKKWRQKTGFWELKQQEMGIRARAARGLHHQKLVVGFKQVISNMSNFHHSTLDDNAQQHAH